MGKKQLSTDKQNSTESIINPELYNKLRRADSKISKNIYKMPDQKWHQIISFIKSGVRIVGYLFIPFNLIIATVLLVVSEVIGIIEELV